MAKSNRERGQEVQVKLAFYVIALIFTVLGLSIQTAKFGTSIVSAGLELLAWVSLLVSRLAGLRRLELTPGLFYLFDIPDQENTVVQNVTTEMTTRTNAWYRIHKYGFVIGFILLVIARGYLPAANICDRIAAFSEVREGAVVPAPAPPEAGE